ncbi:MAG: efflux RND transporter periplasmic adaptor subunit [Nitrospirae bacterium]|nr:efflux RND transporter periplasmic adaptor subunit [Nitrospirota bacterium]
MKRIFLLCCLLSTAYCLIFLPACKKKEARTTPERVINVQVQAAKKKSFRPFIETIGTLNPYEEVIVSAEVDGILKDVKVDEGTVVSKGMVLAAIDDTDYDLEVKKVEAALKQAEASLANTRLEYQRNETLYKEELVTKQKFDDVSTRLSIAEADIDRAKAALAIAKQKLTKTKIYSSLTGLIKEKKVSVGDYVRNGTNLFVIIQNNPLKLNFTVTEKDVGKIKKGQEVTFKVDAFSDKEFNGKLSIIYPGLDEKTRTLQVEALVPNPKGLLKSGLFTHVTLYTGGLKDTVVAPITSLLYEGEKIKIFVVEEDRAEERPVKIGKKHGEMMEITQGLREGEQVVVVGQQNLSEGIKINVSNRQ